MDITSLVGLAGTVVLIIVVILIEGGNPIAYINAAAALTAIGGTLLAICLGYPMETVKKLGAAVKIVITAQHTDLVGTIKQLVEMCSTVRRDGLLALDTMVKQIDDKFLASGTQYVVDGLDPDTTRSILEADIAERKHRHAEVRGMFEFAGNIAPGYALVGTLLGLVAMLANLDPKTVGHKMSLALLCTFYGCTVANAVFTPMATKLKLKSEEECLRYKLITEGLLGIQAGENPRNLEERLKAFLPMTERLKMASEAEE